jgi:hypothetical protein
MILKIFVAALLFEIVSAPLVCAVGAYLIKVWHGERLKFYGTLATAAGAEIKKHLNENEEEKTDD